MNRIVSLMAAGTRKRFSREEYRRIREEADYGNWVPAAMMKTLWTATAAISDLNWFG